MDWDDVGMDWDGLGWGGINWDDVGWIGNCGVIPLYPTKSHQFPIYHTKFPICPTKCSLLHGNVFQRLLQQLPEWLDGGNEAALRGSMGLLHRWTE